MSIDHPTPPGAPRKKRGRPRKPEVKRNTGGDYSVRTTVDVDGHTVRKQFKAGTTDRTVARVIGKAAAAGGDIAALVEKGKTFREHAEAIVGRSTINSKKARLQRLRDYAYPEIGDMPIETIKVTHVRNCLVRAAEKNGWTATVRHTKNDISAVLGRLVEEDLLVKNAAAAISFRRRDNTLDGQRIVRTIAPRVILTDAEFEALVEYLLEEGSGTLGELGMLCLCARMLGGMRTSDLHAWRWDHIDVRNWLEAQVPRPKTQGQLEDSDDYRLEPYDLTVDGIGGLVQHLISWWHLRGCPTAGPVFPVRRGKRLGQQKAPGTSYARELRDQLWAAGVVRPAPGYELETTDDGRRKKCVLQSGMKGKRSSVDFHSFRRAFVTATSKAAGLSFSDSMRLADHSDPRTHLRYKSDGDEARVIPSSALPRISAPTVPKMPASHSKISNNSGRVRRDSNAGPVASEAKGRVKPRDSSDVLGGRADHSARQQTTQWQNPVPELAPADPLAGAIEGAIKAGQFDLAKQLVELAEKRSAPAPKNVVPLRKRR